MLAKLRSYVAEKLRHRLGVPSVERSLARLAACGFTPASVYDVGAYQGDFAKFIHSLWPTAAVTCFEVQLGPISHIQKWITLSGAPVQVITSLLGSEENPEVMLNMSETSSSVLDIHVADREKQAFPMSTVDAICAAGKAPVPELLKLDVQGFELAVLKGAEKTLPQVKAILLEANLLDLYKDVPLAHEVIAWLAARDFVMYDFCSQIRRPLDKALWQTDLIFVPKNSPLRADKRWSL